MKVDGRQLQAVQYELEISPEAVCFEADISMSTLYKVYADKPVSRSSVNRVRKALGALKERSKKMTKAAS